MDTAGASHAHHAYLMSQSEFSCTHHHTTSKAAQFLMRALPTPRARAGTMKAALNTPTMHQDMSTCSHMASAMAIPRQRK
eukprot:scaffold96531_cov16-Tisochrysis_lutea.AAC.1